MQEIELTPTRKDALEFAYYLASHPEPETIIISPLQLIELAERAQIRAEVAKIMAETDQIEDEQITNAGYDERGAWHRPDAEDAPVLIADPQAVRMMRALLVMCAAEAVGGLLIWAVVHFAQKAGLPW
jgi:hypothetical protein